MVCLKSVNIYRIVFVLQFTLFLACNNKSNNQKNSFINKTDHYRINNKLYSGQITDSLATGFWSFRDNNGTEILSIIFTENSDSIESYEVKLFNTKGKVMYNGTHSNMYESDEIFISTNTLTKTAEIGELLYETHLKNIISLRLDYMKAHQSNPRNYIKSVADSLRNNQKGFPEFTPQEINFIVEYLNRKENPIYD